MKRYSGFAIIESVIAIVLISIMAVYAMVNWPGYTLDLGSQAEQFATDLRYTQALSMTQGQRYCLYISGSGYQIINSATSSAIPLASGATSVTLGTGISFGTISPANMFIFDGVGQPYSSIATTCNALNVVAATALSSAASITLTASGQTRTVSISPTTGRVVLQ